MIKIIYIVIWNDGVTYVKNILQIISIATATHGCASSLYIIFTYSQFYHGYCVPNIFFLQEKLKSVGDTNKNGSYILFITMIKVYISLSFITSMLQTIPVSLGIQ